MLDKVVRVVHRTKANSDSIQSWDNIKRDIWLIELAALLLLSQKLPSLVISRQNSSGQFFLLILKSPSKKPVGSVMVRVGGHGYYLARSIRLMISRKMIFSLYNFCNMQWVHDLAIRLLVQTCNRISYCNYSYTT